MKKAEFVARIAEQTGNTKKHTEEMLNAFLDGIGDVLAEGDKLNFVGFGVFEIDDVIDGICKKMIYRHPHVFGNVEVSETDEILNNWDDLKMTEKHQESVTDTLNSVARTLPSLIRAQKIQKKAAKSGFEWADVKDAIQKVHEELDEVERAMDGDGDISEEIGDLLFATAKVARFAEVDAERALELTCEKFIRRFSYVESKAEEQGRPLSDMTLDEMTALWNEGKTNA